jgi:small redox-active disulfide protein 2
MKSIKVLGPGCTNCNKLFENVEQAATQLGLDYQIEKVTDMDEFAKYGVMLTPALVVDNKVITSGSVPSDEKLKQLLSE